MSKLVPITSQKLIATYFPKEAFNFVFFYFKTYKFDFLITTPRVSKNGDFRQTTSPNKLPLISVNGNLHPYEFLLVFLHELAHFLAYKNSSYKITPHGKEWKKEYKNLLDNALKNILLPDDIAEAWHKHSQNIKSSSALDIDLVTVFNKYRNLGDEIVLLRDLQEGDTFIFRQHPFKVLSFARTRAYCISLINNNKYLINQNAIVKNTTTTNK